MIRSVNIFTCSRVLISALSSSSSSSSAPPRRPPVPTDPSLQVVLHKNLMRLRLFMASPEEPIPDAPKDWMPPVARAFTPPPGKNASGDAAEASASARECFKEPPRGYDRL